VIAGRYSLRNEIGRGGMGVVWRAEDELLGRDVAMKRIGMMPGGASPAPQPDRVRAAREARLAATLSHPNVVSVFDLAHEGDEQWLVMEYVDGATLAQLVREQGPLDPDGAARLLCQAADALAAAHRAGIVHRDVKPSNILVTPAGQVKLTDFGIARGATDATLTATGMMTGSPAYLAPEVASGTTATSASDVWSLGATLYHALTGEPPYEVAGNVVGALYRIVHEEPPRPPRAGWLAPLLEATMTKEPGDRWTMAEVADFLSGGGGPCGPVTGGSQPEDTAVLPPVSTAPPQDPTAVTAPVPSPRASAPPPRRPEPAPEPAPASTREPAPASASASAGDRPAGRRGRGRATLALLALIGAAAVVAAVYLGWNVLTGGADDGRRTATPESTASTGPSSPDPSPSEEDPEPTADAEEMEAFVQDYLATVTSDPRAAWQRLTPGFQQASGSFGAYRGFWGRVDSAEVTSVSASPEEMTVSYAVTYQMADGTTTDDDVVLDLVLEDGRYLIAGER
jgi:eukaryotic-like serine/threonine-protein kinase